MRRQRLLATRRGTPAQRTPAAPGALDFAGGVPAGAALARAAPALAVSDAGVWSSVAMAAPRIEGGEFRGVRVSPETRNRVRNSIGWGTSPTATPANWTLVTTPVNGVTIAKIGEETRQGIPGSLIRISGVCSADTNHNLNFETNTGIAAVPGNIVTLSYFAQLVSGDRTKFETKMLHTERGGVTTILVPLYGEQLRSTEIGWHSWTYTIATTGTTSDVPGLRIRTFNLQTYDEVIWIGNPQWELGSALGPPVITSADEATVTGTSIIPNSTHSGAATTATLPTGHQFAVLSGLTRTVAAVGSGWVEYEMTGTPASTGSFDLVFSANDAITATVNDFVGMSVPVRIVSGSLANTQITPFIVGRDTGGTALSGQTFQGQAFPAISTDRTLSFAATLTHASTARVTFALRFSGTSGAAISVRFRVGTIIANRGAANVRLNAVLPGEVLTVATSGQPWWGGSVGSLSLDFMAGRMPEAAWTLLSVRNSTGQHGFRLRAASGTLLVLDVIGSGSVVGSATVTTERLPRGVPLRVVVTWTALAVTARIGSVAAVTVAQNPQLDAASTIRLGCDPAGLEQPDITVRRLRAWPTALTAAEAADAVAQPHHLLMALGYGQSLATGSNGFIADPIAAIAFMPESAAWPRPGRRTLMLHSPTTVPAQRSDPRGGSNRLNGSATAADQQVTAAELIYLDQQLGAQFTTGASGLTPVEILAAELARDGWPVRHGGTVWSMIGVGAVGGITVGQCRATPSPALTNGNVPYNDMMMFVTRAVAQAAVAGMTPQVQFVLFDQGESDNTNASWYTTFVALRDEMNAAIVAATGQAVPPRWLLGQHSTFDDAEFESVQGILNTQVNGVATVWGPKYPYLYDAGDGEGYAADLLHMTAGGYTRSAEKAAQFARELVMGRALPVPLRIISVTRAGNSLTLRYSLNPGKRLKLEPGLVPDPGQMGFAVRTSGGTNVPVSAVRVTGPDTIVLDCASAPGAGCEVRYALAGYPGGVRSILGMARGCVADDDPYVSPTYGTRLPNFALHQRFTGVA